MNKIVDYVKDASLIELSDQLKELHYQQILSEGKGRAKTPAERFKNAYALDFINGLLLLVDTRIKKHKKRKERHLKAV